MVGSVHLSLSQSILVYLGLSVYLCLSWSNFCLSLSISDYITILEYFNLCRTISYYIWNYLGVSGTIRAYMGVHETILDYLGISWINRDYLGLLGMKLSGTILDYLGAGAWQHLVLVRI